jgi:chemotaxis methyl-accepting protein methylase
MNPGDEEAFTQLAAAISRVAGLPMQSYKNKCLRRRIAVRMRACGIHTYPDYQKLLDGSPEEVERLRDALTINVTRFYRNAETWDLLRDTVLREICGDNRPEVRAWSAGCATGEEPYTLAMLMADCLESQGRGERLRLVTIDATDVDRDCLVRAEAGRYPPESLVELPPSLLDRYVEKEGSALRVTERLRRRVVVRSADLSSDPPPRRNYHLILCRNVVIYFERKTQERIFSVFADALAPGGFLVLGKVETLLGPARERLSLLDPRERVYRRAA